jgi:8-oxo-dGTP diphosphatase
MKHPIRLRAGAIIFRGKKLMVTRHHVPGFGVYYVLPGGGVEHAESPKEALIREVKEETGLNAKPGRLVFFKSGYTNTEDYLDIIFSCNAQGKIQIPNEEKKVLAVEFVDYKQLKKLRFYPKQIVNKVFKKLPEQALFLGKFKYPED